MKQVILVPMWLGMSPGKVASQCCHVTAAAVRALTTLSLALPEVRVILKIETKKEMAQLWDRARWSRVDCFRFKDSAPTTEGTAGKFTAYSFVGRPEDVDALTGHLELY